jgi:hypothetical protein
MQCKRFTTDNARAATRRQFRQLRHKSEPFAALARTCREVNAAARKLAIGWKVNAAARNLIALDLLDDRKERDGTPATGRSGAQIGVGGCSGGVVAGGGVTVFSATQ